MTTAARLRVALLVDHPDRDLPGLVLTAVELCRQGAACHLVPANLAWREIWALAPDLVVFNYFRRSNQRLAAGLAEAGIPFVALDTEGGVWPDLDSYTELLWDDPELRGRARGLYCWGSRMADHLVSAGFFRREQVQVTGCPRFDFYHPFWRAVLAGPGVNAPAKRPRILINTNFSTRNPRFATVDQKIETSQRNFGWSRARIEEILSIEECAITAFIELSARLAEAHPECEILLRPHPFEGLDWYRRELASSPNVVVDNEGPVQPVLFGSALVIQRSCTTAVEAGLAGVPTLSPQWVIPPFLMPVAEAVSVPCDDYASLAAQVALVLEGRYTLSPALLTAIDTMIHDWFHRVDGEGYRRVARAILEALPPGPVGAAATARRRLYLHDDSGMPLTGIRRIAAGTRLALGLSPDWSFRHVRTLPRNGWRQTAKFYDATLVQDIADRCTAILQGESVIPLRAKPVATQSGPVVSGFGHSVTLEAGP